MYYCASSAEWSSIVHINSTLTIAHKLMRCSRSTSCSEKNLCALVHSNTSLSLSLVGLNLEL